MPFNGVPVFVGTVNNPNAKISLAIGNIFFDLGSGVPYANFPGAIVTLTDTTGKTLVFRVIAPGTGETFGAEQFSNPTFDVDTSGWSTSFGTLLSVPGGQSGNCLQITEVSGAAQVAYQTATVGVANALYRYTMYVKSGTSGNEAYRFGMDPVDAINFPDGTFKSGTSSGAWVQDTLYTTPKSVPTFASLVKFSATVGTMLFDTVSLKQVLTPSSTGATALVLSQTAGFNLFDTAYGVDIEIQSPIVTSGGGPVGMSLNANYAIFNHDSMTISTTPVGFNRPKAFPGGIGNADAYYALVTVEGNAVRFWFDGSGNPDSTHGNFLNPNDYLEVFGNNNIANIRFIRQSTADGTLMVSFGR